MFICAGVLYSRDRGRGVGISISSTSRPWWVLHKFTPWFEFKLCVCVRNASPSSDKWVTAGILLRDYKVYVYLIWGQQGFGEGCAPIDRKAWTSNLDPPARKRSIKKFVFQCTSIESKTCVNQKQLHRVRDQDPILQAGHICVCTLHVDTWCNGLCREPPSTWSPASVWEICLDLQPL